MIRAHTKGIVVYWSDLSLGIEKGFYSNNYMGRTASEMGYSPRLLVKMKLPAGKDINDVSLPSLPSNSDLDFPGQQILMMRYAASSAWPESWNVEAGNP